MSLKKIFLGYIKMVHETIWIKNSMKERHTDKSYPVHIEKSYQSDKTSVPLFGRLLV